MFKKIERFGVFITLCVSMFFIVSFVETIGLVLSSLTAEKLFGISISNPSFAAKAAMGGLLVSIIGPVVEEFSKSIFLKDGRSNKWAYGYAVVFAIFEGILYVPRIMNELGLTLVWAILMRIPALLMHPATVHFQINGKTKFHGLIRGIIIHSCFNILAGAMFFWTI